MPVLPADADRALAQRVARTYGGERDPWTRVEEYERVQRAIAEHPQKGSAAIASIVDLPRGRIRAWVDGEGAPDPVRGLQTAASHGWLTMDTDDPTFRGLNVLVAWVYSGGSIARETYTPRFAIAGRDDRDRVADAFERVGVGITWTHTESERRATEAVPETAASVLGRVLVALGAPHGEKRDIASLPWYLDAMPRAARLDWAQTYVCNRGTAREDRANIGLQIREERPQVYLRQLAELFGTVATGTDYGIRVTGQQLYLEPSVAEQLAQPPIYDGERRPEVSQ